MELTRSELSRPIVLPRFDGRTPKRTLITGRARVIAPSGRRRYITSAVVLLAICTHMRPAIGARLTGTPLDEMVRQLGHRAVGAEPDDSLKATGGEPQRAVAGGNHAAEARLAAFTDALAESAQRRTHHRRGLPMVDRRCSQGWPRRPRRGTAASRDDR